MSDAIEFRIAGMHCASCSARSERALRAAKDVIRGASVNLATETATVRLADGATLQNAAAVVEKIGFSVPQVQINLAVDDMTCASCVGRVERVLRGVAGVTEASVNLAAQSAQVTVFEGAVRPDQLIDAVKRAGYPARAIDVTEEPQNRHDDHANDLQRSTWIAIVLGLPVFVLEMGAHLFPSVHHWIAANIGMQNSYYLQFVLSLLVLAGPGRVFYRHGIPALLRGAPDMNSLVALGTLAAFGFSMVVTFAPKILPEDARNVYFEAAVVIVVLILIGRMLEARAKGQSGQAIRALIGLRPKVAMVERGGQAVETEIENIILGDLIHLRPGERVAVDGTVASGNTYIDESMITGEPIPIAKSVGDGVVGGTLNGAGAISYRATAVGADTVLSGIVRMVSAAQGAKLPVQAVVDRITLYFVPVVLAIAALTVSVWLIAGGGLALALAAGVSVLIIACPCAMGLATPMSIMVGTGRAAQLGVLMRKGEALQRLQSIRAIAFDKTGTLTEGRPTLTDVIGDENLVLTLAAAVEAKSEHPVAGAIVRAARDRAISIPDVDGFETITGQGVRGRVGDRSVLVGSPAFMAANDVQTATFSAQIDTLADQGKTPFVVAADGAVIGVLAVADPIKPEAKQVIKALLAKGIHVAMVTGDNSRTARAIGGQLGIDDIRAQVSPAGKTEAVRDLQTRFGVTAFIGDGINDAPALAQADVGIAMGTGTDIAMEAGDVVLMSGNPMAVLNALTVSEHTMRNIWQNLTWAFGYNVVLVPVAAGALYPAFGILLSPMLAAGAMALSSVFVVTNALRLRRVGAVAGSSE